MNEPRDDLRALLGEQLWRAGTRRGWTQADLADHLGISEKHLSQAVNGKSGSPEFFEAAARKLGLCWKIRLAPVYPSLNGQEKTR